MINRLVHYADIVTTKDDSYRLKDRDLGRTPPVNRNDWPSEEARLQPAAGGSLSTGVDTLTTDHRGHA